MFEALGNDIAAIGDHGDEDTVREFVRCLEQMLAAGAMLIGEFDASQMWALSGAANVTQWLTPPTAVSPGLTRSPPQNPGPLHPPVPRNRGRLPKR
jgi:hypothetical protein